MMALVIVAPELDPAPWVAALHAVDRDLDIRVWPDDGERRDIHFAITWNHPPGELLRYPNLKCVASLAAGVDHILRDPNLPDGIRLTRLVHPLLTQRMIQYVLTALLNHHRSWERYRRQQTRKSWSPEEIIIRSDQVNVGIMGLGNFGLDAAIRLAQIGFHVRGWSRSEKRIEGVQVFFGDDQLDTFLSQTDVLICLLALTSETRNILNRQTFDKLPPGAYLINVARGEHLVDEDLLAALNGKHLSGACLDVFRTEPLPPEHPFWHHPRITVTPHIAVGDDPKLVAPQIVENYQRIIRNKSLLHEVDPKRGY
jgi:glyoxylate/hydroxypyruvate reductase A